MRELTSFEISLEEDVWKVYYTFCGERELMYAALSLEGAIEWIRDVNEISDGNVSYLPSDKH